MNNITDKILKDRKDYTWHGTKQRIAADIEHYLDSPYYITLYTKLEYLMKVIDGFGDLQAYFTKDNTGVYIYEDKVVIKNNDTGEYNTIDAGLFDPDKLP